MAAIARNLRALGRRRRLFMGGAILAAGVAAAAVLVVTGAPRGARLALVLPFYLGMVNLLQFRDHT